MPRRTLCHRAAHEDSWWRVYDEYGQWGFTDRGACAALLACLALLMVAQQLAWAWR